MLEKYTLNYAPSAAVLQFTDRQSQDIAERATRYLFVGDPANPPRRVAGELPPLPGARQEIATIARRLPSEQVVMLAGSQALETNVRSHLGDSTVIHLATHGVGDVDPLDTFLALGRSDDDREEAEGRLTAAEVYGLDLHAGLVVLSACHTLLTSDSAEGLACLTRAFLSAGAASVIATVWDVADETTYRLMPAFYELRASGRPKAEALRSAQLQLLRDLRASRMKIGAVPLPEDPFFWAAFVLFGEP